jgi:hypothetical protein
VAHDVAYLPSISTLEWIRRRVRRADVRRETVAVVAAPDVDSADFRRCPMHAWRRTPSPRCCPRTKCGWRWVPRRAGPM